MADHQLGVGFDSAYSNVRNVLWRVFLRNRITLFSHPNNELHNWKGTRNKTQPLNHQEIVRAFYSSFEKKDAEGMVSHYHPQVLFKDPAFGVLEGEEASDMWRMLISKGGANLKVELLETSGSDDAVKARWRAHYEFGKNKRKVVNEISATFEFRDGKIIQHIDEFDLWKWAVQAMGISGRLLGWTTFFKKKVRSRALRQLQKFRTKNSV